MQTESADRVPESDTETHLKRGGHEPDSIPAGRGCEFLLRAVCTEAGN